MFNLPRSYQRTMSRRRQLFFHSSIIVYYSYLVLHLLYVTTNTDSPSLLMMQFLKLVFNCYMKWSQVSGCLLQTAQTWANAGVCSTSCSHALGIMFVCLFVCLFELVCFYVLQAI